MDKRKQFQIQHLSSTLTGYNNKLANLTKQQTALLNSISQTINPGKETDSLADQKQSLEARIQSYKNDIIKHRSEHTRLSHQVKLLPGQLETNKHDELDIYNEEIQNITGRTQEAKHDYLDKQKTLEVNKSILAMQIQSLQNQVAASQDNITSIQEHAHSYRKNTLLELKQKKQQKVAITNTLNELNKTRELYSTNYIEITNRLDGLNKLKTRLIDTYYSESANANTSMVDLHDVINVAKASGLIPEGELNLSSDIQNAELFNTIIANLDKQIQEDTYLLSSITRKSTRLDKTISKTANDLVSKLGATSREKVASYKDNYKNAKMGKISLEEELARLQSRMNSWDVEVFQAAENEYTMLLESLEADTLRAKERLDIMTARIMNNHVINQASLAEQIKQVELNLANLNNLIKESNQELAVLLDEINTKNATKTELDKINSQMATMMGAIEKIKADIKSLSS